MSVERQQGTWYQPSLLRWRLDGVRHGAGGEGGTGPVACEESQALTALERERALTRDVIGGMRRYNNRRNRRIR
jgi:hypothetical protein